MLCQDKNSLGLDILYSWIKDGETSTDTYFDETSIAHVITLASAHDVEIAGTHVPGVQLAGAHVPDAQLLDCRSSKRPYSFFPIRLVPRDMIHQLVLARIYLHHIGTATDM